MDAHNVGLGAITNAEANGLAVHAGSREKIGSTGKGLRRVTLTVVRVRLRYKKLSNYASLVLQAKRQI